MNADTNRGRRTLQRRKPLVLTMYSYLAMMAHLGTIATPPSQELLLVLPAG